MNQIIKASTMVSFETTSGYESRAGSQNKPGVTSLVWALDEIARVMTIDGKAQQVREAIEASIARTEVDLRAAAQDGAQ